MQGALWQLVYCRLPCCSVQSPECAVATVLFGVLLLVLLSRSRQPMPLSESWFQYCARFLRSASQAPSWHIRSQVAQCTTVAISCRYSPITNHDSGKTYHAWLFLRRDGHDPVLHTVATSSRSALFCALSAAVPSFSGVRKLCLESKTNQHLWGTWPSSQ